MLDCKRQLRAHGSVRYNGGLIIRWSLVRVQVGPFQLPSLQGIVVLSKREGQPLRNTGKQVLLTLHRGADPNERIAP